MRRNYMLSYMSYIPIIRSMQITINFLFCLVLDTDAVIYKINMYDLISCFGLFMFQK